MKKFFAILSICALLAFTSCTCGRQQEVVEHVDEVEVVDSLATPADTLVVAPVAE